MIGSIVRVQTRQLNLRFFSAKRHTMKRRGMPKYSESRIRPQFRRPFGGLFLERPALSLLLPGFRHRQPPNWAEIITIYAVEYLPRRSKTCDSGWRRLVARMSLDAKLEPQRQGDPRIRNFVLMLVCEILNAIL
jgi:hypothetical protein